MKHSLPTLAACFVLGAIYSGFGEQVVTLARRTNNCDAIALDATHVYWTEPGVGIHKVPKVGGDAVSLATITNAAGAIAVFGNYVYWAESQYQGYGAIRMAPVSGGPVLTVASGATMGAGNGIRGLVVDSSGIYWIEAGSSNASNVGSLRMLGGVPVTDPVALANTVPTTLASNLGNPTGLASDNGYLYWIEYVYTIPGSGSVKRVPKSGGPKTTVVTGLGEVSGIAVDKTHAYFGIWNGSVYRVPKGGVRLRC